MTGQPILILGIDGGGSKTTALLADAGGRLLGRGAAGPSNYQAIGAEAARATLLTAVAAAFNAAGQTPAIPAALCLGMAGVGRPEDRAIWRAWAEAEMPGARVVVTGDADLVLAAGTPEGWGVALICGTGSIAFGMDAAGGTARAGGWGYLLGDEGSGYAIGLAALRAVARAHDGRGPATALSSAILQRWKLPAADDLIGRVYRGGATPADIAALAPLVEAAAAAGDATARSIMRQAGRELALALQAVVKALALPSPTPCALAGGLVVHSRGLRTAVLAAARRAGLHLSPVALVEEPAQGALKLAARQIGG